MGLFLRPVYKHAYPDLRVELWVSERKFPYFMRADAIVVPVAPDLKMVFGVAKMARDYGAGLIQREADRVAPLQPGDAFIGTGGRYRFTYTALAVIFDELKTTSTDLIVQGVTRAIRLAHERGCRSVVVPDVTENLLAQPQWITREQRRATAYAAARATASVLAATRGLVPTVRIWVWDPLNADCYLTELKKLERTGTAAQMAGA